MNFQVIKLDMLDQGFSKDFEEYKQSFLNIIRESLSNYYGDDYQLERIKEGNSILYLGVYNNKLVGASYVKRNGRRGVTAIYPDNYRRFGGAEKLILASFEDFPEQYTIIRSENSIMINLLKKLGFK